MTINTVAGPEKIGTRVAGMGGRRRFAAMTGQAGSRVAVGSDDVCHGLSRVACIASRSC